MIDCTVQCAVVTRNHESTVMSILPLNGTNFTPGIDVSITCIYSAQQCISVDAYLWGTISKQCYFKKCRWRTHSSNTCGNAASTAQPGYSSMWSSSLGYDDMQDKGPAMTVKGNGPVSMLSMQGNSVVYYAFPVLCLDSVYSYLYVITSHVPGSVVHSFQVELSCSRGSVSHRTRIQRSCL